jgi:phosphodiesterase/alkaline phosphatase D-like protein
VLTRGHLPWAVVVLLAVLAPAAGAAQPFQPGAIGFAHRAVCGAAPLRVARCNSQVVVDVTGKPLVTPGPAGFGPSDLQSAYGLTSLSSSAGGTQTIAIVDAYDAPSAEADLGVYRSRFGLSPCTTANGCFRKVNQRGGTMYPKSDGGWAQEISLDLDMASAICPNCNVLLVEADSAFFSDLSAAVDEAATLGATQISNSYGGSEYSGETTDETHYNHPGIAVTVSSGDSGYGVEFPAASRYVTAVGGTSLVADASARGWSETAWSGAGSGCSAYVPKPSWQTDSGCARRTVADVSAVADPNTGVAVYDSFAYHGSSGWMVFGGTSVASPVVAAFDALIGSAPATRSYPYDNVSLFNDVTSGSNGSCGGSYLCTAKVGYDGPTGVGTPMGAPPSASKPSVTTLAASSVGASTATLNGTVDPNGLATTYHFEYGTSTSYGSQSPAVDASAGSGSSPVPVSTSLSGLTPGTTYHFRLVATNTTGTADGADQTFTTGAAPVVATQAATLITAGGAQLNGTVDPGRLATTYHFAYGTTTAYGSQSPAVDVSAGSGSSAVAVSTTLSGLTAGTTYHFRLVATNAAGTVAGSDQIFTTLTPPVAVTGSATSVLDTTATLNGSVDPHGLATTYHFEYGLTAAYGSRSPAVDASAGSGSSPVSESTGLSGLTPGTTYHFRLVATSTAGTSSGSDQTFATGIKPSATTQAASSVATTAATLNGGVNPNGAATTYHFDYGATASYGSQSTDTSAGSGSSSVAVSANVTGLAAGTTYHFRVVATNAAGTVAGSDQIFTTLTPPVAVTGSATSVLDTTATLDGSVDPNASATSYRFEYGPTAAYGSQSPAVDASAGSGSSPVSVSADLSGLTAGTTYHFRLVATSTAGTSTGSDQTFTTGDKSAVTIASADSVTAGGAGLSGSVTPNRLATTYRFEYGTSAAYGAQSPAVDADAGSGADAVAVSTTLSGLAAGTTYHFRLVATNPAGTTVSADRTLTTADAPAAPPPPSEPPPSTTTPTAAAPPAPSLTTATSLCAPTMGIARRHRVAVLRIRCAQAGTITASVLRGKHRITRARRTPTSPGTVTIRLRIPRRTFGQARSLRLKVKVIVVDAAGTSHVLRRRVTIRR